MKSKLIQNRRRAKQLAAFDDLEWGKCRPTDIDFSMDIRKGLFVFGEMKGLNLPLTTGQRIHLEGLVQAIKAGGKDAVAFLAHHNTPDPDEDVEVSRAIVDKYFDGNVWQELDGAPVTVVEFVNSVVEAHNKERD